MSIGKKVELLEKEKMNEYEFILDDRIAKIQAINEQYDLEHNAYLSFSGGKDSTVLHYLLDMALPNNNIPRLFINTNIEYNMLADNVKVMASKDKRIVVLNPKINIKKMLEQNGYPFKSKQHSHNLAIYQSQENIIDCGDIEKIREQGELKTRTIEKPHCEPRIQEYIDYHIPLSLVRYLGVEETSTKFRCPKSLLYQFQNDFTLKCSDKCCIKLKKEPAHKWQIENNKTIVLTGMRKAEGGQRANIGCIVTDKDGQLEKFHPLVVVSEEWENWFLNKFCIKICNLYYEPYNFKRTGCKCCPFSLDLEHQLYILKKYFYNEYKQVEIIWKPVYDEYRRIGYRLDVKIFKIKKKIIEILDN